MFYVVEKEGKVRIPPEELGKPAEKSILVQLHSEYEGRVGEEGIYLAVFDVEHGTEGKVVPGDPGVYLPVKFKLLVFKPLVNEILPAKVTQLVDFGFFCNIGPVDALVHLSQIGQDFFVYDKKKAVLSGKNSGKTLKKGDLVFVKIATVSMKDVVSGIKVGATMRSEGLGKLEWLKVKEKKS